MSSLSADAARPLFGTLRREFIGWVKTEAVNWVFALKICTAALLAMWLSMRFELDQPRTAMITVFVVMQPQTGMVLAKSLYRIGATVAGTLASLLLVGLFAQERVLFLVGLALWIGLCTAGSAFYRNFRSYGWVLAGYTAAMIGLPAAQQPDAFFSIASTRLSEVVLGILCAGVVSDVIFPRRLSDTIISKVRSRYVDFAAFVRASLSSDADSQELDKIHLRLVGSVLTLESIRSIAILEDPEVRARDLRLRRLNSEFMAVSTTFHSFRQLLKRLTKTPTRAGSALTDLYESLGKTLTNGNVPRSADDALRAARRIAASRVLLSRRVAEMHAAMCADGDSQALLDFETAVELLHRFLRELHAYTRTYATLPGAVRSPKSPDDIKFAVRTDPLVALVTGGRAFIAILLTGSFWIASAWPHGISALLNAAIVSALFAAAPVPHQAVKEMIKGYVCGFLAALVFKFLVIPSLDGFLLLGTCMAPFLIAGGYLTTRPKLFGMGTGFLIFFTYNITPENLMNFNPIDTVNDGIATVIGLAAAGIMFGTLLPSTGSWLKRRMARQLRHQVVRACFDPLDGLAQRFESGTRDVLHTQAAGQQAWNADDRLLLAWLFSVSEIGRAVVHLRLDAGSLGVCRSLTGSVDGCVISIARLFESPSQRFRDSALACVNRALDAIHGEIVSGAPGDALRRVQTSLHLIRTALLDEETALANV